MRWDHLAHLAVGFSLVLGFSVSFSGNPRLTTPLCLSAAIGREAFQKPKNNGPESSRDLAYTLVGCGIGGLVWQKHKARDLARDTLLINARLRIFSLQMLEDRLKADSARADSIAKARRNSMKIAE